ncbi:MULTISPECIES: hypothetical protein [unclassified Mesorhizobium]|uniref:TackOD1 domain-containing metal-binding protein n=1 Tax=unclassified Mesorhizobium TaxID=325217 RepID=UPI00333C38AF
MEADMPAELVAKSVVQLPAPTASTASHELTDLCLALWARMGLSWKPAVEWFPRVVVLHSAIYRTMFDSSSEGDIDAVLLADERRNSPLDNLRDHIPLAMVPVIDLGGRAGRFADVHFDLMQQTTWAETAKCILDFRRRREQLAAHIRSTNTPETRFLAHAFVAGRSIEAKRYPMTSASISYPGFPSAAKTIPIAEDLSHRGLLLKTFFDRVHECGACGSRRLTVREECPSCRSADMFEAELIHHYRCAALRPEGDFRQGSALVCPKCSQQLRHYGKDYDKPGHSQICRRCKDSTSEPAVGFVCQDCDARADGDSVKRIDFFSYALTDQALSLLTSPEKKLPTSLLGLPPSLVQELDRARMTGAKGPPLAVTELRYGARDSLIKSKGQDVFEKLRRLFIENLSNYLAETGSVHKGAAADYFIMTAKGDETLSEQISAMLSICEASLGEKLDPRPRVATKTGQASR